jgi:hypothetical protein
MSNEKRQVFPKGIDDDSVFCEDCKRDVYSLLYVMGGIDKKIYRQCPNCKNDLGVKE